MEGAYELEVHRLSEYMACVQVRCQEEASRQPSWPGVNGDTARLNSPSLLPPPLQ